MGGGGGGGGGITGTTLTGSSHSMELFSVTSRAASSLGLKMVHLLIIETLMY